LDVRGLLQIIGHQRSPAFTCKMSGTTQACGLGLGGRGGIEKTQLMESVNVRYVQRHQHWVLNSDVDCQLKRAASAKNTLNAVTRTHSSRATLLINDRCFGSRCGSGDCYCHCNCHNRCHYHCHSRCNKQAFRQLKMLVGHKRFQRTRTVSSSAHNSSPWTNSRKY